MKPSEDPIVVEQAYDASPEAVWEAITQLDKMVQWYFDNIPAFEAKVGFETEFDIQCGERNFPHLWKVTEVVPQRRLVYDWKFGGYPGDSYVTFELTPQDSGSLLTLTHRVRETFPDDVPEFQRPSCLGGWTYFLQDRLKDYLAKSQP